MKLIFAIAVLSSLGLSMPAVAENLEHLSQLLATNQCPQCDLSGSGLVLSNLSGAQLSGTNLVGANLSQANLSGADLSGANLSGASLNGANLTGANLTGAILVGADLRGAYLTNANFTAANLDSAYVQGAIDIPSAAGTPESFYGWGLNETQKGNYKVAIEHYNQAISLNPEFAPAYLAKGYALLRLGNEAGASQNGEIAAKLFEEQKNDNGYETSQSFVKNIKALQEARTQERGNAQFDSIVRGVGSILLRFLLNGL